MPADVTFDSAATTFQNIQIYRDFQFGKLMQLVMTDERLYRADHAIAESTVNPATGKPLGSIGSRYLVPQALFDSVEGQKMAAATKAGADPLAAVGMLGTTQRDWWKSKMKAATSTWKLWGNEVSLLRMGLNGTDAIATLLALSAMSKVGQAIASTLPLVAAACRWRPPSWQHRRRARRKTWRKRRPWPLPARQPTPARRAPLPSAPA